MKTALKSYYIPSKREINSNDTQEKLNYDENEVTILDKEIFFSLKCSLNYQVKIIFGKWKHFEIELWL